MKPDAGVIVVALDTTCRTKVVRDRTAPKESASPPLNGFSPRAKWASAVNLLLFPAVLQLMVAMVAMVLVLTMMTLCTLVSAEYETFEVNGCIA